MRRIGIMQGRLVPKVEGRFQSFPRGRWRDELGRASEAGLECIEWIYDVFGLDDNPFEQEGALPPLAALAAQHGVAIRSVCADYFMERLLLKGEAGERGTSRDVLVRLLERCGAFGVERIVLPFVDASSLSGPSDRDGLVAVLDDVLLATNATGVELHLETDLGPAAFAELLARLPSPRVRVNYDSGNSASLGYRPRDEFAAYGDRVGSVHVKDRVRGGGTVPLGTGHTDFAELATELARIGYRGDFILQAARGAEGDEVRWAAQNRAFVEERILPGLAA